MRHLLRRLAISATALIGATATFLITYRFGFLPAAALALVVFSTITLALLPRFTNGAARSTWTWAIGSIIVYLVAAQGLVGRAPERAQSDPAPPADQTYWTLSNGRRVAYSHTTTATDSGKAPVVFVHGGPGVPALGFHRALQRRPLDFLAAQGRAVYYYDQPGSGFSDRVDLRQGERYSVAMQTGTLEEIRKAIGAERLVLVAEGFGATIVSNYLLQHAAHVERVVFASPAPLWAPAWEETVAATARASITDIQASALAALQRPTLRLTLGRMMADFSRSAAHQFIADWEADAWWTQSLGEAWRLGQPRMTCKADAWSGMPPLTGLGFFANSYTLADALRLPDPRSELKRVQTEVLVLRGTCDAFDWQISNEYLTTLPGSRYVAIPAAGHFIWHEQEAMWRELISGFLRGERLPLEVYDSSRPQRVPAPKGQ